LRRKRTASTAIELLPLRRKSVFAIGFREVDPSSLIIQYGTGCHQRVRKIYAGRVSFDLFTLQAYFVDA
jgi:hypothetical protein